MSQTEVLKKIVVSANCRSIEEEEALNRKIFDFNHLNNINAVKGTSELSIDLVYVLDVLIEENSIAAFIAYLKEVAPEANI